MDNLTTAARTAANNITKRMLLGNVIDDIIDHAKLMSTEDAAPVNAVAATKTLTISGVVTDGETVTFNNPAVAGTDVYEFLTDAAQTKTVSSNIAVNVSAYAVKATGTLTVATQPTAGDTMVIGSKTFTFVPVGTDNANGEISVGADVAAAKVNIVAAVNGTDAHNIAHPQVSASVFSSNDCTLTALVGGVGGNSIATTETFTAVGNLFGAATLGSGASCSATNAVAALVAAITANDTQGILATDGTGDTVDLVAEVAGVSGNSITLAKTLANGSFASSATALSGGVDGTVGSKHELRSTASYLYVCTDDNTVAGANWRRMSLGSAY